jgi:hypothetical protein
MYGALGKQEMHIEMGVDWKTLKGYITGESKLHIRAKVLEWFIKKQFEKVRDGVIC